MLAQLLNIVKTGGGISTDILVLVGIFAIIFFYGLYFGKNRLVSFVLAYYPAMLLYQSFPFADKLTVLKGVQLITLNEVGIFLLFLIPLNIIVNRYVFAESALTSTSHIFRVTGLALAGLALVLTFSYTVVDLSVFYNFGASIDKLFVGQTLIWVWRTAPLVLLAFF